MSRVNALVISVENSSINIKSGSSFKFIQTYFSQIWFYVNEKYEKYEKYDFM